MKKNVHISDYAIVFPYTQENLSIAKLVVENSGNKSSMERDNGIIGMKKFDSVLNEDEISPIFKSRPGWGLFNLNVQKGQGKSY